MQVTLEIETNPPKKESKKDTKKEETSERKSGEGWKDLPQELLD